MNGNSYQIGTLPSFFPCLVAIPIKAALVRVVMQGPQVFMELLVLSPGVGMFVKFFVQLGQVMMETLMGSAARKQQTRERKCQHGQLGHCPLSRPRSLSHTALYCQSSEYRPLS